MTFTDDQVELRTEDRHDVHFYESDDDFAPVVADFLAAGLRRGEGALVVATPEHRSLLAGQLRASGIDVEATIARRHLVMLDALETLRAVSGDAGPDPARFAAVMEDTVGGHGPTRIFGEMVALLCDEGRFDRALALEEIWCHWLEESPHRLLCAYPTAALDPGGRRRVCLLHHAATGAAAYGRRPPAPYVARSFAPDLAAVGRARSFVADSLRALGSPVTADDVALVTTELAANAVLHAGTTFLVELVSLDDGVAVSVHDRCAARSASPASATDSGGRGLQIVGATATRWGVEQDHETKVVWAEFGRDLPERRPD